MAYDPPSRALTLADVLAAVTSADVSERRRQDMASAVRCVARTLERAPGDVLADPPALRRRLKDVAPLAHDISSARWNNVRSLLRAALGLLRPVMKGRSTAAMSPAWQALFSALATQSDRSRLSRLLRWLSVAGIEPATVGIQHLQQFRAELLSDSLRRHPEQTWVELVRAWHRSVDFVAGFPQLRIERVSRKETYVYPWSTFPASLEADVKAWLDRLAGRDLSDDGPSRPVRPQTLELREYQLRAFASALVRRGNDPASLRSLADLVTYGSYVAGLKFYYERRGNSSSTAIQELAAMLKSVARHWAKADPAVLQRMAGVMRRLAVPRGGLTTKNRERLRAFDDEANVQNFLGLPQRLRKKVDGGSLPPHRAAVLAGIAVAIELLIMAPIRRQNLATIEIDRHLLKVGRKLHLVIPGEEVKNGADLEFELPARSIELLDWYLRKHRPLLAPDGCPALFPNKNGRCKGKITLALQVSQTVFAFTGLRVNAHLFRHIGAKLYLDAMPGSYEVIRRVLGHKAIDTTTRFYVGTEVKAAVRHFDDVILRRHADSVAHSKGRAKPAALTSWRSPS